MASVASAIMAGVTIRQFWGLERTAGGDEYSTAAEPSVLLTSSSRSGHNGASGSSRRRRGAVPNPNPTTTPTPVPTATRRRTHNEYGFYRPLPERVANVRGGEYPRDTVPLMPPEYASSDIFKQCDANRSEAGWALNDGRWRRLHVICDGPVSKITCMIDAPNGVPVRFLPVAA